MFRKLLLWPLLVAAIIFCAPTDANVGLSTFAWNSTASGGAPTVSVQKVGAGGWLVGGDVTCDSTCGNGVGTSTIIARPDTYGAWVYNRGIANPGNAGGTGAFQQVVNGTSIPSGDQQLQYGLTLGAIEIRAAPSNTSHLYMLYAPDAQNVQFYSSTNKGVTWTKKTAFTSFFMQSGSNDGFRQNGHFMAIDPINENVVYTGSPSNGMQVTADGGTTFAAVTGPGNANGAWNLPAFDTSGGSTSGRTNNLVVCTNGTGIYKSTNASGSSPSFSLLSTTGMPTTCNHIIADQSGIYWVVIGGQWAAGDTNIHFYKAGAWNTVSTGSSGNNNQAVSVDPYNANVVYVIDSGGAVSVSLTQGASFTKLALPSRVATDIPWLQNTNETFMSAGDIAVDPGATQWTTSPTSNTIASSGNVTFVTAASLGLTAGTVVTVYETSAPANAMQGTVVSDTGTSLVITLSASSGSGTHTDWTVGTNSLIFFEGIGVWKSAPTIVASQTYNWVSMSAAIEQLVGRWISSPWGFSACSGLGTSTSVPIIAVEDRNMFVMTNVNTYPSHQQVNDNLTQSIQYGFSVAWAGNLPQTIYSVSSGGQSKSTDCGATFTFLPSVPYIFGSGGGSIAVSATTTNSIAIQQSNNAGGYSSTDGGQTWSGPLVYPGVPTTGHLVTSASGSSPLTFTSVPTWLSSNVGTFSYQWIDLNTFDGSNVTGTTSTTVTTSTCTHNTGSGPCVVNSGDTIEFLTSSGFGNSSFTQTQLLVADLVTDKKMYAYNLGVAGATNSLGIKISTDGGATWGNGCITASTPTTCPDGGAGGAGSMRAVPGIAGEFWTTGGAKFGATGHPDSGTNFWKCSAPSTMVTCSQPNTNVKEVWAFGFGKPSVNGAHPAIFIYGWVSGVLGLYRSDDAGVTYTLLAAYPVGNTLDSVITVEGDANVFNRAYICLNGSGCMRWN